LDVSAFWPSALSIPPSDFTVLHSAICISDFVA
jgi:hypothetical protein